MGNNLETKAAEEAIKKLFYDNIDELKRGQAEDDEEYVSAIPVEAEKYDQKIKRIKSERRNKLFRIK